MLEKVKNLFSNLPRLGKNRLTKENWNTLYGGVSMAKFVIGRIRNDKVSTQTKEMLKLTEQCSRILELGFGTGETSIYLAKNGKDVTLLDYTETSVRLAREVAGLLNVPVSVVLADAEKQLPFLDNEFDCVFQAGLLEHYEKDKRIDLCRNWGRVTSKYMISLVPNAGSLAYRVGKMLKEKNNTWIYGLEFPQYTLRDEFQEAGFRIAKEYTVGERNALNLLPKRHYLRRALERWIRENSCEDNCGQGYLLVTVGEKV